METVRRMSFSSPSSGSCTTKFANSVAFLTFISTQCCSRSSAARASCSSFSVLFIRFAATAAASRAFSAGIRPTVATNGVETAVPSTSIVVSHENFTGKPSGSE